MASCMRCYTSFFEGAYKMVYWEKMQNEDYLHSHQDPFFILAFPEAEHALRDEMMT